MKTLFLHRLPTILICIIFFQLQGLAQGILQGSVKDTTNKEDLVGANIFFKGTAMGGISDIEGKFRIMNIPSGTYTVRISYLGYKSKETQVIIQDRVTSTLHSLLIPDVLEGQEVIITAQARGQMSAMNQQVKAIGVVNVVSEEKIKELPDANAAEAIGRLPGVSLIRSGGEATKIVLRGLSSKFSNITLDGVKIPATDPNTRDVDMSTISQGSLAGIELFKTLTPDQDGDAIAGSVNLVTRKAPLEREIRLDLKGDYNKLMKSGQQYDLSGRYGERFFEGLIGLQVQGTIERKIRSKEDITYGYNYQDNSTLPGFDPNGPFRNDYLMSQFTVDFTDEFRNRNGGQIIFDVNTPDSGSVKLTNSYSGTQRQYLRSSRVYPYTTASWDYNYRYTEQEIGLFNSSLQGKNYLDRFTFDWGISYTQSKSSNPYDYALKFTENPSSTAGGSTQPSKDHPETFFIPFALNNWPAATCSTGVFYNQSNFDKEKTAHLDITGKYMIGDVLSGQVKIGTKYKAKNRSLLNNENDANYYLDRFYPNNADGTPKNFSGTRFENYVQTQSANIPVRLSDFIDYPAPSRSLLDMYRLNPLISLDAMKLWYNLNKNGKNGANDEYVYSVISALSDYTVSEKVSGSYVMNTLNFGEEATLIAGVRVENESNDYQSVYAPGSLSFRGIVAVGQVVDSSSHFSQTNWLPNLQLTLKPLDFLTVRLIAYKALARPDFNLRLPQFGVTSPLPGSTGQSGTVFIGNPNLKNATAWNFELNTQLYSNTIGLISVSVFYKVIDNLFHQMNNVRMHWVADLYRNKGVVDPAYYNSRYYMIDSLIESTGAGWENDTRFVNQFHTRNTYNVTMGYNSPDPSYAYGIEFEHQMNFNMLPYAWLRNFSLSYNVSITRSETNIIVSKTVPDSVWVNATPPFALHPAHWQEEDAQIPVLVKRKSEDQPELYANISLGYDLGGFSSRISMFYQDKFTQTYSTDGTGDVVVDSFTKIDLSLKQQIVDGVDLILNVNNLTSKKDAASQVNHVMGWNLPRTAELYGTTVDFGVRLSL